MNVGTTAALDIDVSDAVMKFEEQAGDLAKFLKTFAHTGRLLILNHLKSGELSVGQLESLLDLRQATVSQMLARLRDEGLVNTRRDGKAIYYSLADDRSKDLLELLNRFSSAQKNTAYRQSV